MAVLSLLPSSLPPYLITPTELRPVAHPQLALFNQTLAVTCDVHRVPQAELINYFSGNKVPPEITPCASAYAGHQFGHFTPILGDGRALLLGEVMTSSGRHELQLKGSGRTAFARTGDGRLALGPALREYIISEAMHALGVPTTRALALVTTGEQVVRDRVYAGAVLTRMAQSHLRIGHMQLLAAHLPQKLPDFVNYLCEHHYPEIKDSDDKYTSLLMHIAERQAALIAHWMSLGFIHGVMNTDNVSLLGLTIDYGPCAFMDTYKANQAFSSIDATGRYSYCNQPEMGAWNIARLAETFLPLFNTDEIKAQQQVEVAIDHFTDQYNFAWKRALCRKIGFATETDSAYRLGTMLLTLFEQHEVDFTVGFCALTRSVCADGGVTDEERVSEFFALCTTDALACWHQQWQAEREAAGVSLAQARRAMHIANPVRIPRNHQIEAAIQAAYQGDWESVQQLQASLAEPYQEEVRFSDYEAPPSKEWQQSYRTFCGT